MRALVAALVLLAGCGPAVHRGTTVAEIDQEPGLVSCATGEPAPFDVLLEARAIYVGESHDSAEDHRAQRWVIEQLFARDPSLAIGMEMFQRPFQAPLDRYVAGELDERGMLEATEWQARWNMDFALYRPILEFARAHRLPVIALNARRELTRAIAREGLESLSPELRAELPELDATDPEHRAMVLEALGGHDAMDPARLERFYLAQLTWDETMGESVARAMAAPSPPHRIVVLAGRVHVQGGLGIPRRAARRGITPFLVVSREGPCDYRITGVTPGGPNPAESQPR